ncbi:MAG TPA: YbhB/YbcL family Raf kinase inhibitor-like protein [Patescibacteria group bacterium]|nr:YbhB/YbcL family Raf kinase inhibitor-like protein [Patescibacteria group bacterium]
MNNVFRDIVLSVVRDIPQGKIMTYKQVAVRAGNPRAARAVGAILKTNFDPAIPCHRVIRSDGSLGGYNRGVELKKKILDQEKKSGILYNRSSTMKIESSVFSPNAPIPSKYSCDGENISPPLILSDVPQNTESIAIILDDPDAPSGTWIHWLIWNISPSILEIVENSVPQGAVEGITSFGTAGYGGPCPPSGNHRYVFKAFALDTVLDLGPEANKQALERALDGHILDSTELIGLYKRI